MHFSQSFFRSGAVAAGISVVTLLGLCLLPYLYPVADTWHMRLTTVRDPYYQLRAWLSFLHPFCVVLGVLGIGIALRRSAPGIALIGFLGFFCWGLIEAARQIITLFAYHRWAYAFANADTAARQMIRTQIGTYDAFSEAMLFLLSLCFCIGCWCYGYAMVNRRGLDKWLGALFGCISLFIGFEILGMIRSELVPVRLFEWSAAIFQFLLQFGVMVWLWRTLDGLPGGHPEPSER